MKQADEELTLSQQLAKQLLDRLVSKGLLNHKYTEAIEAKIAEGKMQDADWKLELEKALELQQPTN